MSFDANDFEKPANAARGEGLLLELLAVRGVGGRHRQVVLLHLGVDRDLVHELREPHRRQAGVGRAGAADLREVAALLQQVDELLVREQVVELALELGTRDVRGVVAARVVVGDRRRVGGGVRAPGQTQGDGADHERHAEAPNPDRER